MTVPETGRGTAAFSLEHAIFLTLPPFSAFRFERPKWSSVGTAAWTER
jgi:hypothetical protein